MPNLKDQFMALTSQKKRSVHIVLCGLALHKWHEYFSSQKRIVYVDSVVGLHHEVDGELPRHAIDAVRFRRDKYDVEKRYQEPITALQDNDLEFPKHIKFAYYSIYNLFNKYALGEVINDWLVVNQALSSETDETRWAPNLSSTIETAEDMRL